MTTTSGPENAVETGLAAGTAGRQATGRRRAARRALLTAAVLILLTGAAAAVLFGYLTLVRG